jgi:hypothetical protein
MFEDGEAAAARMAVGRAWRLEKLREEGDERLGWGSGRERERVRDLRWKMEEAGGEKRPATGVWVQNSQEAVGGGYGLPRGWAVLGLGCRLGWVWPGPVGELLSPVFFNKTFFLFLFSALF